MCPGGRPQKDFCSSWTDKSCNPKNAFLGVRHIYGVDSVICHSYCICLQFSCYNSPNNLYYIVFRKILGTLRESLVLFWELPSRIKKTDLWETIPRIYLLTAIFRIRLKVKYCTDLVSYMLEVFKNQEGWKWTGIIFLFMFCSLWWGIVAHTCMHYFLRKGVYLYDTELWRRKTENYTAFSVEYTILSFCIRSTLDGSLLKTGKSGLGMDMNWCTSQNFSWTQPVCGFGTGSLCLYLSHDPPQNCWWFMRFMRSSEGSDRDPFPYF